MFVSVSAFALRWLSLPLEVFDHISGQCLYQSEVTLFGLGEDHQVPCGTHGELAVQRVANK